ncbi:GTPase [Clostridium sp.]|uniref:GTPase n=1 Tax=Clostridium sp. TaxID=1506 RepID=UPI002FCC26B4
MEQVEFIRHKKNIEELKKDLDIITNKIQSNNCKVLIRDYKNDLAEQNKNDVFKIAFIGQYSAGKSSIITALTENMNIKVGQNITTDKVTEYKWSDVLLVDTPGIGTDHKEHDELAYRHMDLADLLVYVVTTQGFDDLIAKDFKKIAFERNMSSKMMLVVNKISLESISNKVNWENDVKRVIYPKTLDELRVTFIDAKEYIEALEETDEDDERELIVLSNFSDFVLRLNNFIKEKGIAGKLISEINIIDTYLNRILNEISTDDDRRKIQELLMRKRFLVEGSRKNMDRKIEREVQNLHTGIINISNEFISKITSSNNSKDIADEFEDTKDKVDRLCGDTGIKIEDIVDLELDDLIKKINDLEDSPIYKELLNDFSKDIDFNVNLKEKQDLQKLRKAPDALKDVGKFLGIAGDGFKNWCVNAENVGKGLKALAGSDAHKFVLDVGHFFGKKFKPYEALKIVDKLGKVGEVVSKIGPKIAIVAGIASPLIAVYEEYQEGQNEKHLMDARTATRDNFRTWANEIRDNALEKKQELLSNIHDKELENISNRISSLRNEEKLQSEQSKSLLDLENRISSLVKSINCIH